MISNLKDILAKHSEWAADNSKGQCADLTFAGLRDANLRDANLRDADLSFADLRNADLSFADLRDANLRNADLRKACLGGANLKGADLSFADLRNVNLRDADLRDANLDFSSGIPLWCGGSKFKCEAKLIQQVLAHLCTLDCKNKEWIALRKAIRPFAKKSHRAFDMGLVKQKKG